MDKHFWTRLLPQRQKIKAESNPSQIKFIPELRISRQDDWVYLELLLWNRSNWMIWVEEAAVDLDDLKASWQTVVSAGHVIHKILQNVVPGDALSLSLAAAIYDAAGRPQGQYSCFVLTDIRYRVLNEWHIAKLEKCRVEMKALTVVDLHSTRRCDKKVKQIKGSVELIPKDRKG